MATLVGSDEVRAQLLARITSASGTSTLNSSPSLSNKICGSHGRAAPISLLPNPCSLGGSTGGPSRSFQENNSMGSASPSTCQLICSFPLGVDSEPYLAALVASSCSTNANCCANVPPNTTGMPCIDTWAANPESSALMRS